MCGVKAALVYRRLSRFATSGYEEEEVHTERETRIYIASGPGKHHPVKTLHAVCG